jgi:hypothetical protein
MVATMIPCSPRVYSVFVVFSLISERKIISRKSLSKVWFPGYKGLTFNPPGDLSMTKLQYVKAVQALLRYEVSDRDVAVIRSCYKMGVSKEACYTILRTIKRNFFELP